MFWFLLPGATCIATIVTTMMIEIAFPNGDSRNFGGACLVLALAPVGLVFGIVAIRETFRPKGLRALAAGAAWNAVIVLISCTLIWAIVRFGLLKDA